MRERLFDGICFLCPVSLVLYAFINSFGIIPGKLYSYIAYWLIISGTFFLWVRLLNHVFSWGSIRLGRGFMEKTEAKLLLFRFKKVYTCELISSIEVKSLKPGFLFSRTYDVVVSLKSGRAETIKRFQIESEAHDFRRNVSTTLFGNP